VYPTRGWEFFIQGKLKPRRGVRSTMATPHEQPPRARYDIKNQTGQNYNIGRDQNFFDDVQSAVLERIREGPRSLKVLFVLGSVITALGFLLFMGGILSGFNNNNPDASFSPLIFIGFPMCVIGTFTSGAAGLAVMLRRRR
jgi:hypothetical protein